MLLTDAACRNAKAGPKIRKLAESGLQLWIKPNGSRLWRFSYRYSGKQKLMAIGPYPRVTLAAARKAREAAKLTLLDGLDPMAVKKEARVEREAATNTFRTIAEELVAKFEREGRAAITIKKKRWLLDFANAAFGDKPITDIRAIDILAVLRKIEEQGKYETARRLRSTIGGVFRYAVATARADGDPTSALQGAITTPVATPLAAITEPQAFGGLLRAIDGFDGAPTSKAALQLLTLLFPRPGELRGAEWSEFNFDKAIWDIPAERMKMRRAHRIPLSRRALAVIDGLRAHSGTGRLLFPNERTRDRPFSENTLNAALRRLGFAKGEMTSHGFRSSASTLLNESGYWNPDAIEKQLSHAESNEIRRAYARGVYWEERVDMMAWWADYLDYLRRGEDGAPPTPQHVIRNDRWRRAMR